jgi:PST family polysaccharide transporter
LLRAAIARFQKSAAAKNFSWLMADRAGRLGIGVVLIGLIARHLGTEDFGVLAYAMTLTAIGTVAATFGMDPLAVREIIQSPDRAGAALGNVIVFRFGLSLVTAVVLQILLIFLRPGDDLCARLVLLLSIGMAGQALECCELLFQARSNVQAVIRPRAFVFLAASGLKLAFLAAGLGVTWFALATAVEQVAAGGTTFMVAIRTLRREGKRLQASMAAINKAVKAAWPLAFSSIAVILYMRVAHLIVGGLLGDRALGIYAAATRIPDALGFIPNAITTSLLPGLLRARAEGETAYEAAKLRFLRLHAALGYGVAVPLSLGAPIWIHLLFGSKFISAAPVMATYAWGQLFIFIGLARTQILVNEGQTRLTMAFTLVGLVVCVAANFLMIPRFGIIGSAYATLIAYSAAALFASFAVRNCRPLGLAQLVALITPWKAFKHA